MKQYELAAYQIWNSRGHRGCRHFKFNGSYGLSTILEPDFFLLRAKLGVAILILENFCEDLAFVFIRVEQDSIYKLLCE